MTPEREGSRARGSEGEARSHQPAGGGGQEAGRPVGSREHGEARGADAGGRLMSPGCPDAHDLGAVDAAAPVAFCDLCGRPMTERHCKLVCANCGYQRDCSDP